MTHIRPQKPSPEEALADSQNTSETAFAETKSRLEMQQRRLQDLVSKLRDSHETLTLIAANVQDILALFNDKGKLIYASASFHRHSGHDLNEFASLIHPDERDQALELFEHTVNHQQRGELQARIVERDGNYRWFNLALAPVPRPEKMPSWAVLSARDVTETVQTQERLNKAEQRFRLIAENSTEFIQLLDLDKKRLYESPSVHRSVGADLRSDRPLGELVHPEDRARFLDTVDKVLQTIQPVSIKYRVLLSGHMTYWMEGTFNPFINENSVIEGILIVSRDVTERHNAEQALAENERLLRTLAENTSDYLSLVDRNLNVLYRSPSLLRLLTAQQSDQEPSPFGSEWHPKDRSRMLDLIQGCFERGTPATAESQYLSASGSEVWVESLINPVHDESGNAEMIAISTRNITERKVQSRMLARSEARFRLLADASSDLIALISADGKIRYANPELQQRMNIVEGDSYNGFVHPEDYMAVRDAMERVLTETEPELVTCQARTKIGETIWIEVMLKPVDLPDEFGSGVLFSGRDVSERVSIEHRLRETQKLEAVGQLTGGLAHDFNNLLGIILGNLDILQSALPDNEKIQRRFQAALNAAERGAEVTRSLLAVARRQPMEVSNLDLNNLVEEMLPLIRSSAGSSISLVCSLAPGTLPARLDSSGLSNVLLNLVINARDAMQTNSAGKILFIRTRRVFHRATTYERLRTGWYVSLEVIDNGPGMSPEVKQQAFEPFYTTKERGRGTGLGLAMVYGYAEQLGGTAKIHSVEGQGTMLQLLLPAEAAEAETTTGTPATTTRALVVASDELQAGLAYAYLEAAGVITWACSDADDARRLIHQHPFELLVVHTETNGAPELVESAKAGYPAMKIVQLISTSSKSEMLLEKVAIRPDIDASCRAVLLAAELPAVIREMGISVR